MNCNSFAGMKILIVRFSSIGDIVLTSPVVRVLKEQLGCEIHFLTKKAFKSCLAFNPHIDKLWLMEKSLSECLPKLKKESYDEVIDLHNSQRSRILLRKLSIPSHSFNKLNVRKWWYVQTKRNVLPEVHIVDLYLDCCKHLGVINDQKGLDYFLSNESQSVRSTIPDTHQDKFFAAVIGGQHPGKVMPADKWSDVLSQVDYPVVLLGGPEDKDAGEQIAAKVGKRVFNACGAYSLNDSAALVRASDFVVSHDTGLMHIAAAFRKNIISLWGATVPEFGMYPYLAGEHSVCIQPIGYRDMPYSKLGNNKWYKKDFEGWNYLSDDRLVSAIKSQIELLTP